MADTRVIGALTGVLLAGCKPGQPTDEGEIGACGDRPGGSLPGPPTLVSARMEDDLLVRLTFTEPLASVADLDPASFRLSWAYYSSYEGYEGYTAYYDPMLLLCLSSDFCPDEYTDVIEIGCAPDDPSALLLRLDVFSPWICELVELGSPDSSPLLPHFDAGLGTVTDLDGEPLASIAAHFVTAEGGYAKVDGEFPNYPIRIPIECP